ncbi:MAG: ABC transporter ATP-binding protein, partial [Flavobacterium sp.]
MILAKNIHKRFDHVQVLKGVDIEVKDGEVISIVGASGAGKTTLLHILGTLDKPNVESGTQLFIDNQDILSLNDKQLSQFRNQKIGFIFQFHQLLPEFTALENVCIPAFIKGTERKIAEQ